MTERKHLRLIEIARLASENASRALSKLSGEKIRVDVSKVEIKKNQDTIFPIHPEAMVAGVYMPVTGEIKGASLLVFPEKMAGEMCDCLVRREAGTTKQLTELDKSALKEVGNIICGSFLTVLSNTLKIKIIEHVPNLSIDMYGAVVDQIVAQFALSEGDALVFEVKFIFEKVPVDGYVVLIFGIEELQAVIKVFEESE